MAKKPKKDVANFFRNVVEEAKLTDTAYLAEKMGSAEFSGFIDTGSFSLNALLSGRLTGGIPNNKVIAFAGESATGKTFFALGILKHFLDTHPDAGAIYYDTEAAVTTGMMEERDIDTWRVIHHEPTSVEGFRTHAVKFLDAYMSKPEADRPPLIMVLDSLGALSTKKEIEDISKGDDKRDMTRSQLIRGAFRVLRLKLAAACVPMIVTNHVYAGTGPYTPKQIMSGGGGLRYAADEILFLRKKAEKDGEDVVGQIITVTTHKSRFTRDNQEVEVRLSHRHGLDRYYGLKDIAESTGTFVPEGKRFRLPDGRLVFGKAIDETPDEIYVPEVMDKLQEAVRAKFMYGNAAKPPTEVEVEASV